jgi:hypothetical protein
VSRTIPQEYLPDYMRSRSPFRDAVTSTVAPEPAKAPDLRDVVRQALGADIAEATANAVLEMIAAGGAASIMPNDFVPKGTIVITCHPDVYAHLRRLIDEAKTSS